MMKVFKNLLVAILMGVVLTIGSAAQDDKKRPDPPRKETDRPKDQGDKGRDRDNRNDNRDNKGKDERKKP